MGVISANPIIYIALFCPKLFESHFAKYSKLNDFLVTGSRSKNVRPGRLVSVAIEILKRCDYFFRFFKRHPK